MIDRHYNADYINLVANHPSVRGGAKIDMLGHDADFSAIVANPDNVLIAYEGGCFLLLFKSPGVYELHTMALKHGRGKTLRQHIVLMLIYMFEFIKAERIETMAFIENAAAIRLAEQFAHCYQTKDGIKYYAMNAQEFQNRSAA